MRDGKDDFQSQNQAPARPDLLRRVEWLPILLADCCSARQTGGPFALRSDRGAYRHA